MATAWPPVPHMLPVIISANSPPLSVRASAGYDLRLGVALNPVSAPSPKNRNVPQRGAPNKMPELQLTIGALSHDPLAQS